MKYTSSSYIRYILLCIYMVGSVSLAAHHRFLSFSSPAEKKEELKKMLVGYEFCGHAVFRLCYSAARQWRRWWWLLAR